MTLSPPLFPPPQVPVLVNSGPCQIKLGGQWIITVNQYKFLRILYSGMHTFEKWVPESHHVSTTEAKKKKKKILKKPKRTAWPVPETVFSPGFSTLGSTGSTKKLKGGHKGEKRVTVFRYS